jgi:hypothetical protein
MLERTGISKPSRFQTDTLPKRAASGEDGLISGRSFIRSAGEELRSRSVFLASGRVYERFEALGIASPIWLG